MAATFCRSLLLAIQIFGLRAETMVVAVTDINCLSSVWLWNWSRIVLLRDSRSGRQHIPMGPSSETRRGTSRLVGINGKSSDKTEQH